MQAAERCDACHEMPDRSNPKWVEENYKTSERKCRLSCGVCHVNPSGGMLRNDAGFINVSGAISNSGNTYTFTPTTNLASATTYMATVTTGVKDSVGNALASSHSWTFTTGTITGVSFANTIQPIFDFNCTSCHKVGGNIGSGDASFLPLNSGASYGNLVNIPATKSSGTRVIPGDSADSVLYKRVSGSSEGAQMPKYLSPLSSTNQDYIKTWIDEGALNN